MGTGRKVATSDDGSVAQAIMLAEVTSQLAQTMDAEEAVGRLARLLVPDLADWCVVTLVEDDESRAPRRQLRDIGWWHVDPALRPLVREYAGSRIQALSDQSFLVRALRNGEPVQIRTGATAAVQSVLSPGTAHDLVGRLAPTSATVVPLISRGRTLGALSLFNGSGRAAVSPQELASLRELAANAALVLDNARLYRRQRDVAETFQRYLLTPPVQPDHLEIVVRYHPAAEAAQVGGDWYDAFMQPDGSVVLVIGDVVGHDIHAAALMAELRSMLRAIAVVTGESPAAMLSKLDAALRALQMPTMATMVVVRIEQTPEERVDGVTRLRWASAGHLPPIVVNPDGTLMDLGSAKPGLMLGIAPSTERIDDVVTLERGATLLLYTDGLIESRARPLAQGLGELRDALLTIGRDDLETLCDRLLAQLSAGSAEDDIALVGVRLHRQDRPPPPTKGPDRVPPDVPAEPEVEPRDA